MNRRRIVVVTVIVALIAIAAAVFASLFVVKSAPRSEMAPASPAQLEEGKVGKKDLPRAPSSPAAPPVRAHVIIEKNGVKRASCAAACALEAQCGFREADQCARASCDGDVRIANRSDFCLDGANDCAAAASCPCEESCWKRGECAGDHAGDAACTSSCAKLVAQDPGTLYDENRCILESKCDELATCGQVRALK